MTFRCSNLISARASVAMLNIKESKSSFPIPIGHTRGLHTAPRAADLTRRCVLRLFFPGHA